MANFVYAHRGTTVIGSGIAGVASRLGFTFENGTTAQTWSGVRDVLMLFGLDICFSRSWVVAGEGLREFSSKHLDGNRTDTERKQSASKPCRGQALAF